MTTDRSEQSGPEVVAWLVTICERPHIYHGPRDPREVHDNGGKHEPLITLSSHQQAVEALRAEVTEVREAYQARTRDWYSQGDAYDAALKRAESAEAEVARLRTMTAVTMGVGNGGGSLFVHGDYDSIKAAQALVLRAESAAAIAPQEES